VVLLASSLGVVFFGFVPELARAARLGLDQAWRVSAFLFAMYHLLLLAGSIWSGSWPRNRGELGLAWRVARVVIPIGISFIFAQFLAAAGFLPSWLYFVYLLDLMWLLLIATLVGAILLMETVSSTRGD